MHNEELLAGWRAGARFGRTITDDVVVAMESRLMGLKLLKDDLTISRREIYRTNAEAGHLKPEGV